MSIRARLVIGFFLVISAGFYYVADWIVKEIRPHYLKAMEESLVDYSTLLASFAAHDLEDGSLDTTSLRAIFFK